ncbi:MAG: hypothetical protein AAGE52_28050 [Myxococcota bacterium]
MARTVWLSLVLVACGSASDTPNPGEDTGVIPVDAGARDALTLPDADPGDDSGTVEIDSGVPPWDSATPPPPPPPPPPTGSFEPTPTALEEALRRDLVAARYSNNYRTEMGGTDSARNFDWLYYDGEPYRESVRFQGNIYGTVALVYVALAAYFDADAQAAGLRADDYLVEQLTFIVSGGVEPTCRGGGHGGHADGNLGIALGIVRNTPTVWERFDGATQERLNFLMQSLTLAGNWSQNFETPNRQKPIISTDAPSWMKRWNPNLQEGYISIMVAALYYYGSADAVNSMLASFDLDDHRREAERLGFTNIARAWNPAENGHNAAAMETLMRTPFTYEIEYPETESNGDPALLEDGARAAYDAWDLYEAMGLRQFFHVVANESPEGRGYQVENLDNPVLGQVGMSYEIIARDAGGERTHLKYVAHGLHVNIFAAAMVLAMGDWPEDERGTRLAARLRVGMTDATHKFRHGWYGVQNGGSPSMGITDGTDYIGDGLNLFMDVYRQYLDGNMPR